MNKNFQYENVWERAGREADLTLVLPGGVPMFFRRIPAGKFRMGARGYYPDEEPVHTVVIPHEFFLGSFVVTQEQYRAVASRCPALKKEPDPSHFKGPRRPVEQVSWLDATAFCRWLAVGKGLPQGIAAARLPTEAEWEYACRAGAATEYYNGDGETALAEVAWYDENSGNETHPVDERSEAHPFGLFGMHGNVWEWCADVFDAAAYRKREDGWVAREWTIQDAGADAELLTDEDRKEGKNQLRVMRGGSWYCTARFCRSAIRGRCWPGGRDGSLGFRLCLARGPAGQPGTEAEPATGDGGRGTRPQSHGAGDAAAAVPDLASAKLPRVAGRKKKKKGKAT